MPSVGSSEKYEDTRGQKEPVLYRVLERIGIRMDPRVPRPEDHKAEDGESRLRVDVCRLCARAASQQRAECSVDAHTPVLP